MDSNSYAPPVKKKSYVGIIILIVVIAVFGCCGLLGLGMFTAVKQGTKMLGCTNTIGDYRDALIAYSKKHDGKLPAAAHWQDDVKPFYKAGVMPDMFKTDKPVGDDVCDASLPSLICFNSDMAGKKVSDLDSSVDPILFEAKGSGKNVAQKYSPQAFDQSPTAFNKPRGWIEIDVYGDAYIIGQGGAHQPMPRVNQPVGAKG